MILVKGKALLPCKLIHPVSLSLYYISRFMSDNLIVLGIETYRMVSIRTAISRGHLKANIGWVRKRQKWQTRMRLTYFLNNKASFKMYMYYNSSHNSLHGRYINKCPSKSSNARIFRYGHLVPGRPKLSQLRRERE